MGYHAVGDYCAVDMSSLNLAISQERALSILFAQGFEVFVPDIVSVARSCIGKSQYRRGAHPREAPEVFDCSSFTKWVYEKCGVWLPRRSIQQRELGDVIELQEIRPGDLVFVSGYIDWFLDDPQDGVGHVGIFTESRTVIHAANKKQGVIETPIDPFIGKDKFRGARRYIFSDQGVMVFRVPQNKCVETSDDFRWIILQSL